LRKMGRRKKQKIKTYLAGPIGDVSIKEARAWRQMVSEKLAKLGIEALNPLDREGMPNLRRKLAVWRKTGNLDAIRLLVSRNFIMPDLKMVEESDFITMWLPRAGREVCGSYGEITFAFFLGKPVYIVTHRRVKPLNIPYWAVGCSTKIFKSWEEYFKYVEEYWSPLKRTSEMQEEKLQNGRKRQQQDTKNKQS